MAAKRKLEFSEFAFKLPDAKKQKKEYANEQQRVLVFSPDNEHKLDYKLYSFPLSLYLDYKPLILVLGRRRNAYCVIEKEVLDKIGHLEQVDRFCKLKERENRGGYFLYKRVTYMDVWFDALNYWCERKVVIEYWQQVPMNVNLDVTFFDQVLTME